MPGLVVKLQRRPGEKEARYAHLLSGEPQLSATLPDSEVHSQGPASASRIGILEADVAELRRELQELKEQFAGFQKQFE
jgi:uncharacterized protein YceH (UPF0502 family)